MQPPPPTLFPAGVRFQARPSYERARAFASPAGLALEVGTPTFSQPQPGLYYLEVPAVLRNPTDVEIAVIGFPAGHGPFFAELVTGPLVDFWSPDDPERPKGPPLPPSAPPPPQEFVVPAHAEISFRAQIALDRYRYRGAPEVEVSWQFLYWNPPKPAGRLKVTLPQR